MNLILIDFELDVELVGAGVLERQFECWDGCPDFVQEVQNMKDRILLCVSEFESRVKQFVDSHSGVV